MPSSSTYPSIPIPQNNTDSLYQAVSAMRQTVQLLIVNSQKITDQTITKASQIFSKKSDHTDIANSVNNNLASVSTAITNLSQTVSSMQVAITTLQGQVAALEGHTGSTNLDTRMTTAEGNITSLQHRVTTIESMTIHDVRVRAVSSTINNAIANGGFFSFDTVDFDSDGFAPTTTPFDHIRIPTGLNGIYVLVASASGTGNQSTSIGMGVLVTGTQKYSETNQTIFGPGSVSYILDADAIEILHLSAGDTIQLVNNSVSSGTNAFTSVALALVRIEVP